MPSSFAADLSTSVSEHLLLDNPDNDDVEEEKEDEGGGGGELQLSSKLVIATTRNDQASCIDNDKNGSNTKQRAVTQSMMLMDCSTQTDAQSSAYEHVSTCVSSAYEHVSTRVDAQSSAYEHVSTRVGAEKESIQTEAVSAADGNAIEIFVHRGNLMLNYAL